MSTILSIPIFLIALMLQMGVIRNFPPLIGSGDLIMLVIASWSLQERVKYPWNWSIIGGVLVALVTKMPFFVPIISYLFLTGLTKLLLNRIWQIPVLALFLMVSIGSVLQPGLALVVFQLSGNPLPLVESLGQVIFPSFFINLLLALPVYILITDLAKWIFPREIEE
jgi:hypothetical protein